MTRLTRKNSIKITAIVAPLLLLGACVSPAPAACDACAAAAQAQSTANQALSVAQQALARANEMYQRTLVK
jgi:hypothetical protein